MANLNNLDPSRQRGDPPSSGLPGYDPQGCGESVMRFSVVGVAVLMFLVKVVWG